MKKNLLFILLIMILANHAHSQKNTKKKPAEPDKLELLKQEVITKIDNNQKLTQEINDMLFSFSELGFQEFET